MPKQTLLVYPTKKPRSKGGNIQSPTTFTHLTKLPVNYCNFIKLLNSLKYVEFDSSITGLGSKAGKLYSHYIAITICQALASLPFGKWYYAHFCFAKVWL